MDLAALYAPHVATVAERFAHALNGSGFDALIIHSGSLLKRSQFDDQYWPLRPVPHFAHLAELRWPDCAIEIRPGARPRLIALRDTSYWERPDEPDWSELNAAFDVREVARVEAVAEAFSARNAAFIGEDTARAASWGFGPAAFNPPAILRALDEVRVFKTPYEIACLAEANRIAAAGHHAVAKAFLDGESTELNLHLLFLKATGQDDPETPYKNIVAVGEHAAILHHVHYRRGPFPASSLLLDAGATFRGYASDITRTYSRGDSAEATEFEALLSRMDAMQQALVAGAQVGRPYESLHDEAHARLGDILSDLKIVRTSGEAAVARGITRLFFPHGLGHSLGLQCHDVGCAEIKPRPDNPFLRNTRTIEPDQVFTIEPGIYFIDTLLAQLRGGEASGDVDWARVKALRDFGGIRIEDDVRVLPDGVQNLTRAVLPR